MVRSILVESLAGLAVAGVANADAHRAEGRIGPRQRLGTADAGDRAGRAPDGTPIVLAHSE